MLAARLELASRPNLGLTAYKTAALPIVLRQQKWRSRQESNPHLSSYGYSLRRRDRYESRNSVSSYEFRVSRFEPNQ